MILCAARCWFFFFVHHSSICEQWHGYIRNAYTHWLGNAGFTIYFILFDFQMELNCQLRLNRWERNCLGSMSTVQLQHISKCEMLFMFSSNVCMRCVLCGHFLFNFETIKAPRKMNSGRYTVEYIKFCVCVCLCGNISQNELRVSLDK